MTKNEKTIARTFARLAKEFSIKPAIQAEDITLSYFQLWKVSCGFAVSLREAGVCEKSVVVIWSRDMVANIAFHLAASLIGCACMTGDEYTISAPINPTHLFCTPDMSGKSPQNCIMIDSTWPSAADKASLYELEDYNQSSDIEKLWWLTHTSGTTGSPKYLGLSQSKFLLRCRAMSENFSGSKKVFCSLFPSHTRIFLIRAFSFLLRGGTIVDSIDPEFILNNRVDLVLGSPHTILEWLKHANLSKKIPTAEVTGGRLITRDVSILLKYFKTIEDVYGASETSRSYINTYYHENQKLCRLGKPHDSEIKINLDKFSEGQVGQILVRNSYMIDFYINEPDLSKSAFSDGWFNSGDIGSFDDRGTLVIAGRNDDIINLGGTKVHPSDVEKVILEVSGISRVFVCKHPYERQPECLIALLIPEHPGDTRQVISEGIAMCKMRLAPILRPTALFAVSALPLDEDGCVKRSTAEKLAYDILRNMSDGMRSS